MKDGLRAGPHHVRAFPALICEELSQPFLFSCFALVHRGHGLGSRPEILLSGSIFLEEEHFFQTKFDRARASVYTTDKSCTPLV